MSSTLIIFIIGGTGAQGLPIIRSLVSDKKYIARVLTRDPSSARAQGLKKLTNVELLEGSFDDVASLHAGFHGAAGAFVNIDGFNVGEKGELFWGMRAWEIAITEGVKFFVWGNLDYVHKLSGWKPEFRCGHYDGKGRIGEWILKMNEDVKKSDGMRSALFTTGPYLEMAISSLTLMTPKIEDGVVTWRVPASVNGAGAVCHVALEDCGPYVRWMFDNPDRVDGIDLAVAIGHLTYEEIASAFEKVTGHKAQYIETTLDEYWRTGAVARAADMPTGWSTDLNDKATMKFRDNFSGFWRSWQASGGDDPLVKRDYKLLDEIHPGRIKTAEQWFRVEEERGKKAGLGTLWERVQKEGLRPILKNSEDKWSGAAREIEKP